MVILIVIMVIKIGVINNFILLFINSREMFGLLDIFYMFLNLMVLVN